MRSTLIPTFQIDLARHHPSLNNPRAALGQTQMSTFPRAPSLMFASGCGVVGGGSTTVDPTNAATTTGSHHIRETPPYGIMTSTGGGGRGDMS